MVCDNAYESIDPEECRKIHKKVAEELSKKLKNDTKSNSEFNPVVRELAHHYLKCHDFELAMHYQSIAGKQVLRLSAYSEAIEYFEGALDSLKKLDSVKKEVEIDIRIKLGVCLKTVYGWNDLRAVKEYDLIIELCRENENQYIEELATIVFGRWASVMMRLEFKKALQLANQYLSFAQSADNKEVLMQAHLTVANNLYWMGDIEKSLEAYNAKSHNKVNQGTTIFKVVV